MNGSGHVESTRFPFLTLRLTIGSWSVEVEALLDTGFDGDVALPPPSMPPGLPVEQHLSWILADGSAALTSAYLGTAKLGPFEEFPILIAAIGDEPLVG